MQALYDVATDNLTIIGERNGGQERIWRVVMRFKQSDGQIVRRTVTSKEKRRLGELAEVCRDALLIEHLTDEGTMLLGFEAFAR